MQGVNRTGNLEAKAKDRTQERLPLVWIKELERAEIDVVLEANTRQII